MEFYKKKDLTECVYLLDKANNLIANQPRLLAVISMAECQALAVKLGTYIEKKYSEDESRKIISQLEQYCELVYQLSELTGGEEDEIKKKSESIHQNLSELEKFMDERLPDIRRRIVFLPYKVSMWDSMESIWRAAKEDPETEAVVVPIPYFEKNPDGSMGEMHDEEDQYPEDVPIVDWKTCDLEEMKPDAIIIHNPYDNYNYVTTIHPEFYSSVLKKYTDCLVYVPYYILDEPDKTAENWAEYVKSHCTASAVFNADLVFVQSGMMREAWLKCLGDAYGEEAQKVFATKIYGYGSPKMDCLKKEYLKKLAIPADWKKRAEGRKVYFYNTSVGALLYWGEPYFEKIWKVFHYFEEHQELLLLWRPHPLMISTIMSMRPEYMDQYQELLDYFKEQDLGILDETPRMYEALALSDVYYGDGSSVMSMCYAAGRKVCKQEFDEEDRHPMDVGEDLKKIGIKEDVKESDEQKLFGTVIYEKVLEMV